MSRLVWIENGTAERRKIVAVVLGPSRSHGKVRVRRWSNATQRWGAPKAVKESDILGPAPEEWSATRRARAHLTEALS